MSFSGTLRERGRDHVVSLTLRDGVLRGSHDGLPIHDMAVERRGSVILLVRTGAGGGVGVAARAIVARDGDRILVHLDGRVHEFALVDASRQRREKGGRRLHAADEPRVVSPMTGTLAEVPVKPGDAVPRGGTLAVVEAMKMQFVVRAPRDVVVRALRAEPGRPVDIGQVLVEFEPEPVAGGSAP